MKNAETGDPVQPFKPLTDEQMDDLAKAMSDPEAVMASLPEEEQQKYREAQQSVIDARNSANRIEGLLWIIN